MLHDYLRDTLVLRYNECKSCGNRTQFACVRCGYCYSCHWKKEKLEKVRLDPLIMSKHTFLEKYPQPAIIEQSHRQQLIAEQHEQEEQKIIDVFGQKTEPICNYHAITSFHYMALVLIYVSATIHKIILQEYLYCYHHEPTTNE